MKDIDFSPRLDGEKMGTLREKGRFWIVPENEENRNKGEIEATSGATATEQQREVALEIAQLLNDELFPLLKLKKSSIPDVEAGKVVAMNGVLKHIHELTAPFCNN